MKELAISIFGTPVPPPDNLLRLTNQQNLLSKVIQFGIQFMFIVAIIIALVFMVLSGIQWITSGGNKEGIQKARQRLIFAIIGLIIVFLAFFVVNIVGGLFGADLLNTIPDVPHPGI
ncbi:MAG: pilin [Patescibacteria group bacterium]|nr:pilin [Patescibacteria group bacterium]